MPNPITTKIYTTGSERHVEIGNKLVELFEQFTGGEFRQGDIRLEDFPFTQRPEFGVAISPIGEVEGVGTNERDDIGYVFQAARILHGVGNEGLSSRSNWRVLARTNLHRQRIGIHGCELTAQVNFGSIAIPKAWETWNIDSSVLKITVWVREPRRRRYG